MAHRTGPDAILLQEGGLCPNDTFAPPTPILDKKDAAITHTPCQKNIPIHRHWEGARYL